MIHLDNLPGNLEKIDYFGTKPKAETIASFLNENINELGETKIFALYGNWGSGKTTVMKHIQKLIEKKYETLFFEAWEHEKDDNLALSLCDLISTLKGEGVKDFLKDAYKALKCLGKGVSVSIDQIGLKINGKDIISSFEEETNNIKESIFYNILDFKKKLSELENDILGKKEKKKIAVFIDDLDRCEPENVLKLLAAIKLFFTYGNRIVFFIGLDKDAVKKAIQLKYSDIITSEEYLEKIIDVSFTMPKTENINKIIEYYFPTCFSGEEEKIDAIARFFKDIGFTTPRHVKKVLNKYQILVSFKKKKVENHNLIPNIIHENNNTGVFSETILTMFFIILFEFYKNSFYEIENYEGKIAQYARVIYEKRLKSETSFTLHQSIEIIKDVKNKIYLRLHNEKKIKEISLLSNVHLNQVGSPNPASEENLKIFLSVFTPFNIDNFDVNGTSNFFIEQFNSNNEPDKFLISFCRFFKNNLSQFQGLNQSEYVFWDFFKMCRIHL